MASKWIEDEIASEMLSILADVGIVPAEETRYVIDRDVQHVPCNGGK